jgi:hypothetical protein
MPLLLYQNHPSLDKKIQNIRKKLGGYNTPPSKDENLWLEYAKIMLENAKLVYPRDIPMWKALVEGDKKKAEKHRLRIMAIEHKIIVKRRRKEIREQRKYHSSHKMTAWYTKPWSPYDGGESRFYAHRHCKKCEHAMHEHSAGRFYDPELKQSCPAKTRLKKKK